ncbi:MAG TPA: CoA ester lyase [Geminicoccus sp.]|jgi:citrate lyase subunit beta/citryl-CoA lyase|uniref:HpcH/HpaI aldolase/citrate lyase family protein n=1 Tax=Geminicoccus sp. TaxID=2024832 RepID=UPI002E35F61E|nr:CoA ester lyase [Geminicoccus sp.]HEX2526025.1 CoA ester lyase [Geminicoccus sp.]
MAAVRPRRSVLYMPGSNARALEKAKTLAADALILDLEDSVAPDAKDAARALVAQSVAAGGYGHRELIVRVNGLDTPWGHADLVDAATMGADGVLLPKVSDVELVRRAVDILDGAGGAPDLPIWCMMETARAMFRADQIADHPRVDCLVMGTSDLAKELHAAHTPLRLPMITSLGLCLLAARAAGVSILDGVSLDLQDEDGFRDACIQGAELGFDGKTVIHPKQLEAANAAFAPSPEAVDRAHKMIAAFEEARAAGKGVVVVDGKLVENLHVAEAKRLVALADAIASAAG